MTADHIRQSATLSEFLELDGLELPRVRQVYGNRDVNLAEIDMVGFDMDYTLALYRQEALDRLSVEKTLERLVEHRGYPESVFEIEPDAHFAIRGLLIDKRHGNILKLDAGRHVVKAYHGFREVQDLASFGYNQKSIRMDEERYHLIDTLFALPEAFMFAALIDHFETRELPIASFETMFADIRYCIDLAHRDMSLKTAIVEQPEKYVNKELRLGATLHKMRSAGKKLFLMTNSYWTYTNAIMSFLLDGESEHYPRWTKYFDYLITGARKPRFFTHRDPFVVLDGAGTPIGEETKGPLERGVAYQGGNLADFEAWSRCRGDRVLYIGDHIYGDILKSKKTCFWRTCMIVQEMTLELNQSDRVRDELTRVGDLEVELHRLNEALAYDSHMAHQVEQMLKQLCADGAAKAESGSRPAANDELDPAELAQRLAQTTAQLRTGLRRLRHGSEEMNRRRRELVSHLVALDREIEANFNPYWGLMFKARNENSYFASQVYLFADLYTSTVTNFLAYSPLQYFRAPRARMPHEH